MSFGSILHEATFGGTFSEAVAEPDCFRDLGLDRYTREVTVGRAGYRLDAFYRSPPPTEAAARYRQAVCRDLRDARTVAAITAFSARIRTVGSDLERAAKLHDPLQRQRIFLDTVGLYCRALRTFADDLDGCDLVSEGLSAFRHHLTDHVSSDAFATLDRDVAAIGEALATIRYTMWMHDQGISVRPYAGEADYGAEVERTFEKFRQGDGNVYHFEFNEFFELNHIEAGVLDLVARLFPDIFDRLARFCDDNADCLEPTILRFEREVQFYIAHLDYIAPMERAGLCFCFPELGDTREETASDTFDLVLSHDLVAADGPVVTNDYRLHGAERIFVVSGANQGGKTTFARAFGQLHHLARLGLPVPGRDVRLLFADAVLTHFERAENVHDLHGKLEDDLLRIRDVLEKATDRSVVVLNEIFSSTTAHDAALLGRWVLERLIERDVLGVCVTFLDELSRLGPQTVSLVAGVDDDDPTRRTFRVVRRPADGLSHAVSLAARYGLTHDHVKERLAR